MSILRLFAFAEILVVLFFFFAGYRADAAMDKTGSGDLSQWLYWNDICGTAFFLLLSLWLCSIAMTVRQKYRSGVRGVMLILANLTVSQYLAVLGPVVMLMLGYLLYFPFIIKN